MTDGGAGSAAFDDFAAFYDSADLDRSTEIAFYCSLVRPEARSLLDLGCGTGTITIPMARTIREHHGAAARIVGVDISEKMLEGARRRAPDIDWRKGDMRTSAVSGLFDVAVCCFNSLQLLVKDEDLLECFSSVRNVLAPDGLFAFGIYNPNIEFLTAPMASHIVRSFSDDRGRKLNVVEGGHYDRADRVLMSDWVLVEQDRPDAKPIAEMHVALRQYFPDEIDRIASAAGLTVRERYGEYGRSPFTAQSRRQVVVCGRA